MYDSALLAGLEKTGGTRVPKLPRQGTSKMTGTSTKSGQKIMPQKYEEQRVETAKKSRTGGWGTGKVSLVIAKPKTTIGGFKIDPEEADKLRKTQA